MKRKVPAQFQPCLWSYDIKKMDLGRDKELIITQVLNYGTWDDLKLLYKLYSEQDIKKVVENPRRGVWFEKVLNFWLTFFDIHLPEDVYNKSIFRLGPGE
jgi:hypothetical protein